ncbi:MAG: hypothetical protein OCC45_12695 [Desulfotalea sp.]
MCDYLQKEYLSLSQELKKLTRIERLARRLPIQIDLISQAIEETNKLDGIILELGLGEGRTLEYLENNTSSPIIVFEIDDNAKMNNVRKTTKLVKGDIFETLPKMLGTLSQGVRIAHVDIGTTDYSDDIDRISPLQRILESVVNVGGFIVCDRPIDFPSFELLSNTHSSGWPYYLWRKTG